MKKIGIEEFLALAKQHPVIDVRSPGEYGHAHIPGAYSMPLFTDEERKVVGTKYKQEGRQPAIKEGLGYFGGKMLKMVEQAEEIVKQHNPDPNGVANNTILVHCWRGGMRSAGVAWLLGLYGFQVYTLSGGYKAFRNWVLEQFDKVYPFKILGGYTGSGKTKVLHELSKTAAIIDLEGLAHHKGSAYGALGEEKQPAPEQFENMLALQLASVPAGTTIWLEDESRRIGNINLPQNVWKNMRQSPIFFLDIPFEERLDYITAEYGKFKKEELVNSTIRIQKRLGGLNTKNAINNLLENNFKECFRILLAYYDKFYGHGLHDRENLQQLLTTIQCETVDAKANCKKLIQSQVPKEEGTI
jgi:tRNA 2-selenouridine synthase